MSRPKPTATQWRTSKGRLVDVDKMHNRYLCNVTAKLLTSARWCLACEMAATRQGTVPMLDALDLYDGLTPSEVEAYLETEHPTWPALKGELRRRGLAVPA